MQNIIFWKSKNAQINQLSLGLGVGYNIYSLTIVKIIVPMDYPHGVCVFVSLCWWPWPLGLMDVEVSNNRGHRNSLSISLQTYTSGKYVDAHLLSFFLSLSVFIFLHLCCFLSFILLYTTHLLYSTACVAETLHLSTIQCAAGWPEEIVW